MTREEMLKRLEAGESPIKISLDKWENLKVPEKMDGRWFFKNCLGSGCALCEIYTAIVDECDGCPLSDWWVHDYGGSVDCNNSEHPWSVARDAANKGVVSLFKEQQQVIIDILKTALKDE